jgi:hypothetical protein
VTEHSPQPHPAGIGLLAATCHWRAKPLVEPSAWTTCLDAFSGREKNSSGSCVRRSLGHVPDVRDFKPLIGRWNQVVDAPRHVREKVHGEMTLEWLRDEKVILQRSTVESPMFPEGVVLIMTADEGAEGDFTAHYFDSRAVSRVLHMTFRDNVWKWWRYGTGADDFDQRFEGSLSSDGKTIDSSCYLVQYGEWIHDFDVTYTRP